MPKVGFSLDIIIAIDTIDTIIKITTEYYYKGYINRFDTKYQFSKFIGLRLAAEYNDFSESIFFQPLFEWTPNPFTIFYIGGNQNLIKEQEYYTDRSQFFIKFQYLISL